MPDFIFNSVLSILFLLPHELTRNDQIGSFLKLGNYKIQILLSL